MFICAWGIVRPRTRCTPLPLQTPACRGLVILRLAGSGQARSRLGGAGGGGPSADHRTTPTPALRADPPHKGEGRTEFATRADSISQECVFTQVRSKSARRSPRRRNRSQVEPLLNDAPRRVTPPPGGRSAARPC